MKSALLFLFLIVSALSSAQGKTRPVPFPPNGDTTTIALPPHGETVFEFVEESPMFPGGKEAMFAYIHENLNRSGIADDITGKYYVKFIVGKDGKLRDVNLARGIEGCPKCNAEVLRLVKAMPNWIPGKVKGQDVSSYFTLPIIIETR